MTDVSQSEDRLLQAIGRLREVAQAEYNRLGVELEKGSTTLTVMRWTTLGKAIAFADQVVEEHRG